MNGEMGDGKESAAAFGHVTDVSEVKGGGGKEDTKARPDRTFFPSYLLSCCLFSAFVVVPNQTGEHRFSRALSNKSDSGGHNCPLSLRYVECIS